MSRNYFKSGTWNVICDRCGFKKKASEVRKTWDGLYVCDEDWETRHIADFIRSPKPIQPLPWTRPEGADVYVGPTYTTDPEPIITFPVIIVPDDPTVTIELPDSIMPGDPSGVTPQVPSPAPLPNPTPRYPDGPVIVPVVVPSTSRPTTIIIPCVWPKYTKFKLKNQNSTVSPSITNSCNYDIEIEPGEGIFNYGSTRYIYISGDDDAHDGTYEHYWTSIVDVGFNTFPNITVDTGYTYIINVSGDVSTLMFDGLVGSFPLGNTFQIINTGRILGWGGSYDALGLSNGGDALTLPATPQSVSIDNGGYIFGGGGAGGLSGSAGGKFTTLFGGGITLQGATSNDGGGGGQGTGPCTAWNAVTQATYHTSLHSNAVSYPTTSILNDTVGTLTGGLGGGNTADVSCISVSTSGTNGSLSAPGIAGLVSGVVSGTHNSGGGGTATSTSGFGGAGGAWGEAGIDGTAGSTVGAWNAEEYNNPGVAGQPGGKAIALNGGSVVWISGNNTDQVKGLVS